MEWQWCIPLGHHELIDTLWNVNAFASNQKSLPKNRINRYIMECKSINGSNLTHDERVN